MITAWTKHLQSEDDKLRFEKVIRSAKSVLERLSDLIDEQLASLDRTELDIKTYDDSNWAYKQAYKNGNRAALMTIKKLITLDKET